MKIKIICEFFCVILFGHFFNAVLSGFMFGFAINKILGKLHYPLSRYCGTTINSKFELK
jgi:hypothetical protein